MADKWTPTHRHRKGGEYRLLLEAVWEPDRSAVVVYDDAEGSVWVRPKTEFFDGRFTPIPQIKQRPKRWWSRIRLF